MANHISDDQLRRAVIDAQRQLEYEHAMAQAGQRLGDIPGQVAHDAVASTAGTAIGTVAVTAGMIASRKFRYVVQVILHLIMAFILPLVICVYVTFTRAVNVPEDQVNDWFMRAVIIGFVVSAMISVVWTTAYVLLRTRVKWRKLKEEAGNASPYSYRPQQQYVSSQYHPQYPQNQWYR